MTKYWPMAKVKESDGSIRIQSTYDSSIDISAALNTINDWDEFYHFNIIEAWIDKVDDDKKEKIQLTKRWFITGC